MLTLSTYGTLTPSVGFTVGRTYTVFDSARTRKQTVTLANETNTTLTFSEYLQQFQPLDYICDETFLPFLEIGDNPDGFKWDDDRYLYASWNQGCQDFTGA